MKRVAALVMLFPALVGTGPGRVIDGDTLELHDGERLRIWGIDAPEGSQVCHREGRPWRCGDDAAKALQALVDGRKLTCDAHFRDLGDGAVVAVCWAGGLDVGAEMVRRGWALDVPRHSGGEYADEQLEAESARRGLWAGNSVPPWAWRHGQSKFK